MWLERRFYEKVEPMFDDRGCWEWAASKQRGGYGQIADSGKVVKAHRVSWLLHKGEIPDGMHVLHRCDNPGCVNPNHLFLGTNQDNIRDRETKRRGQGAKPFCRRGHVLDEANMRPSFYKGNGKRTEYTRRVCLACVKLRRSGAPLEVVAATPQEAIV